MLGIGEFPFTAGPNLARGELVRSGESVVLVGPPGTGKALLAAALGMTCVQAGCRARFTTVSVLANELDPVSMQGDGAPWSAATGVSVENLRA